MADNSALHYLEAMGIQTWVANQASESPQLDIIQIEESAKRWQILEDKVRHCELCPLYETRTNTVFGVGNREAKLMLIGEAPGANEDLQGEPFVGRAGQLLNAMLMAIGLQRKNIFIANILKCRPPSNRDPAPAEVACCTPYLSEQISLIKPTLIVALGRIAAQFLLNTTTPISKLRGQLHQYQNTPLITTFHPAYLLRSPREKAKAWEDWQKVQDLLSAS